MRTQLKINKQNPAWNLGNS